MSDFLPLLLPLDCRGNRRSSDVRAQTLLWWRLGFPPLLGTAERMIDGAPDPARHGFVARLVAQVKPLVSAHFHRPVPVARRTAIT